MTWWSSFHKMMPLRTLVSLSHLRRSVWMTHHEINSSYPKQLWQIYRHTVVTETVTLIWIFTNSRCYYFPQLCLLGVTFNRDRYSPISMVESCGYRGRGGENTIILYYACVCSVKAENLEERSWWHFVMQLTLSQQEWFTQLRRL